MVYLVRWKDKKRFLQDIENIRKNLNGISGAEVMSENFLNLEVEILIEVQKNTLPSIIKLLENTCGCADILENVEIIKVRHLLKG